MQSQGAARDEMGQEAKHCEEVEVEWSAAVQLCTKQHEAIGFFIVTIICILCIYIDLVYILKKNNMVSL